MMKRFMLYVIDLFTDPYGVGQKVFWDNPVDSRFREYFTITKAVDSRGLVGVYNKEKGERLAYRHELIPQFKMEDVTTNHKKSSC